jgi:hypothetical protein
MFQPRGFKQTTTLGDWKARIKARCLQQVNAQRTRLIEVRRGLTTSPSSLDQKHRQRAPNQGSIQYQLAGILQRSTEQVRQGGRNATDKGMEMDEADDQFEVKFEQLTQAEQIDIMLAMEQEFARLESTGVSSLPQKDQIQAYESDEFARNQALLAAIEDYALVSPLPQQQQQQQHQQQQQKTTYEEAVPEVWCPICFSSYLTVQTHAHPPALTCIKCRMSLPLPSAVGCSPGYVLQRIQTTLAAAFQSHQSQTQCPARPNFAVHNSNPSNAAAPAALWLHCTACGTNGAVINGN